MVVGASVVVVVSAMFGKVRVQISTLCSFIGTLPLSSLLTRQYYKYLIASVQRDFLDKTCSDVRQMPRFVVVSPVFGKVSGPLRNTSNSFGM